MKSPLLPIEKQALDSPILTENQPIVRRGSFNDITSRQHAAIMEYLDSHNILNTFTARDELNIPHPSGRIKELRELGVNIITVRRIAFDKNGNKHNGIAHYSRLSGRAK